ncbi:CMRF35-like molecule 8 [Rhinichthys klamathensis goyatoka]|uniref:CMRF35-like molecule 8 n=1 Tax=Rhinichthys klamathensis goyatoka TaxID=3034132 RepID=UPI0024B5D380|nr:CMRF35-like molecule 8 [Rhinichthys klamathensis goyatoka]
MLDVLLLFSSICTAVVGGASQTITGYRGERVDIRCSYESGYESNSKYFCKGECIYGSRIIMVESGSPAKDERFSLTDDTTARVFTVTITDLRPEDEGQYWCGVEGIIFDDYSEIVLLVKDVYVSTSLAPSHTCKSLTLAFALTLQDRDNETTEASTISTSSKTPSSFSTTELSPQSATHHTETETTTGNTTVQLHQTNTNLASVAGGLGSVLLVLTLCSGTFIILKKRKRKSGTALFQQNMQRDTETDRMYEEIPNTVVTLVTSSSNQTPASSSNQTPASHHNNCTEVSTVYATVTNQQPDSNPSHTHSTNQVTDTAGDYYAKIKCPEATQDSGTELIYVTATHPQNITTHPQNATTHEDPIYSVINHK